MAEQSPDSLREAAPAYNDLEAKRARAGVAAALFAGLDPDEPDERLKVGRYEIDSRLGAGGMGVVYRAHDPDLERPVAVKLLHTDSSTDDKARARMLREARALAKLSHPNVITVYDVGTEDGQVFVAMELVAGRDLRRWLADQSGAPWRETLALFIAAGRGLAAAHEVALIHRDFKPENVLVGDDGRVRVLDFGLARVHQPIDVATADDRERTPSVAQTDGGTHAPAGDIAHLATSAFSAFSGGLTETGALLGTPLYMGPELYAGRPADARSDQFAFCASLYEGVYRQLPFGSHNLPAHVKAVTEGRLVEPPAHAQVPAELGRIIARGLSADPEARHSDMATLLAELDRVALAPPPGARPKPAPTLRWLGLAAVVVAGVVGLLGIQLGWFIEGTPAQASVADRGSAPGSSDPAPRDVARVESAQVVASPVVPAPEGAPAAEAELDQVDQVEPDAPSGTTGPAEAEAELASSTQTSAELHGWCHLHEDRYTLLSRTSGRRGSFTHQGTCYTCRVERRRSRTRSFSPRDCAGYSLCGEASADACG